MSELFYRVALTKIPKVGAITTKNLISHCGSAEAVFKASRKELLRVPGIGDAIAANIVRQDVLKWAENELDFIEKNAVKVLFHTDKAYPSRLQMMHDSPALLYYKGSADLNHGRIVSIVGTRKPTNYATRVCETLAEGLKAYNCLVVSGLAFGVDVVTHRCCVDLGVPTVGVMGNGLQRIYPPEHRDIARKMTENGGLLTEYPSDQMPDREHFPMRNRIIAGMCDVTIVVETGLKGGSMITAQCADDYNKEVCAVPGRAGDTSALGCNWLIKQKRAHLIESADDVAELLRWQEIDAPKNIQSQLFVDVTEGEKAVVDLLQNNEEGLLIDTLGAAIGKPHGEMASLLLSLEFKGLVRSLPGKRFALVK